MRLFNTKAAIASSSTPLSPSLYHEHILKYFKKSIPVSIVFALSPGELLTKEGVVRYAVGDALATGVDGERWPIRRSHFVNIYEPDANLKFGQDGYYRKKHIPVDARQLVEITDIELSGGRGTLQALINDWLLTAENGDCWIVADSIFTMTYQSLENKKRA